MIVEKGYWENDIGEGGEVAAKVLDRVLRVESARIREGNVTAVEYAIISGFTYNLEKTKQELLDYFTLLRKQENRLIYSLNKELTSKNLRDAAFKKIGNLEWQEGGIIIQLKRIKRLEHVIKTEWSGYYSRTSRSDAELYDE